MFKFILITLISVQAFAYNNAKEARLIAIRNCDERVDKAIQTAVEEGQCFTELSDTCDKNLYNIGRLRKQGYKVQLLNDGSNGLVRITWCVDRKPESIDPNALKPSKHEYCPLPVKGKKNPCKDKK